MAAVAYAQFTTMGGKTTEWAVVFRGHDADNTNYFSVPIDWDDRWSEPAIYEKIVQYRYDDPEDEKSIPAEVREFVKSKGYDYGDRLGFHDPLDGTYFVLTLKQFRREYHEIQGSVSLVATFEVDSLIAKRKAELGMLPFSDRGYWSVVTCWKPAPVQDEKKTMFHPDKFTGVQQVKRTICVELPIDRFFWVGDSLVKRGLEANTGNDSLRLMKSYAGDDEGDIDFYQFEYTSRTDTVKSVHRVIAQRNGSSFRIVNLQTSRIPVGRSNEEYWKVESNERLYHLETVGIIGIVDLDFDGVYEIMLNYDYSDLGSTHGDWDYFILDCSGDKPKTIGRGLGGSSC